MPYTFDPLDDVYTNIRGGQAFDEDEEVNEGNEDIESSKGLHMWRANNEHDYEI